MARAPNTGGPARAPKPNSRAAKRAQMLRDQEAAEEMRLAAEAAATPAEPPPVEIPEPPEVVVAAEPMPTVAGDETPVVVEEGELATLSREINTRLAIAERQESVAEDQRVTAAIKLAEARKMCQQRHIVFKTWAELHINKDYSYNTVRKYALAGASPDPRAAMEELRTKAKIGMQRLRDARKLALPSPFESRRDNVIPAWTPADIQTAQPEPTNALPDEDANEDGTGRIEETRVDRLMTEVRELSMLQVEDLVVQASRLIPASSHKRLMDRVMGE